MPFVTISNKSRRVRGKMEVKAPIVQQLAQHGDAAKRKHAS